MTNHMLTTMARMALEIYVELSKTGEVDKHSAAEVRIADVIGIPYVETRIGRRLPDMPEVLAEWHAIDDFSKICNLATVVRTGLDCMRVADYQYIGIGSNVEAAAFMLQALEIHDLDPAGFKGARAQFVLKNITDYKLSALLDVVTRSWFAELPVTFVSQVLSRVKSTSNGKVVVQKIYAETQSVVAKHLNTKPH